MRGSKTGMEGVEAAPEEAVERGGVQSVGIAATILKALAAAGGVLALKHLAAATGMPRAKVHRYLSSLRNAGLITQDPETGHYAIGSAAVTIGLVGLGRLSPIRQLNDALPRLRDRVNETVTAAIWGDTGPTIIAMEESGHVVTMNVRIGSVLPLTTTAIGQVFLAYLPDSQTQHLVAAEHASAATSPRAGEDLALQLCRIFANGAFRGRASALIPGVDAVAAPVFDVRGKLVAVMCVVGRSSGMLSDWGGPVVRGARPGGAQSLAPARISGAPIKAEPVHDQSQQENTTTQCNLRCQGACTRGIVPPQIYELLGALNRNSSWREAGANCQRRTMWRTACGPCESFWICLASTFQSSRHPWPVPRRPNSSRRSRMQADLVRMAARACRLRRSSKRGAHPGADQSQLQSGIFLPRCARGHTGAGAGLAITARALLRRAWRRSCSAFRRRIAPRSMKRYVMPSSPSDQRWPASILACRSLGWWKD